MFAILANYTSDKVKPGDIIANFAHWEHADACVRALTDHRLSPAPCPTGSLTILEVVDDGV